MVYTGIPAYLEVMITEMLHTPPREMLMVLNDYIPAANWDYWFCSL